MYDDRVIDFYLSKCQEIKDILLPILQILSINDFSFYRIYPDNNRIFFSGSQSWLKNYFDKNYFVIQDYNKIAEMSHFVPWLLWPKDDIIAQQLILDAHNNFDMGNAISIHKVQANYINVLSLRSTKYDTEAIYRYLMNLSQIEYHIVQFLEKAEKIIKEAESRYIIQVPELNKLVNKNKKFFREPFSRKKIFTIREEECLREIVRGKTSKQIANILGISFRTVEIHVQNIKSKLCVHTKSDLITKITSNENNYIHLF